MSLMMTNTKLQSKMPKETADLFKVVNGNKLQHHKNVHPKFGVVDFSKLTIQHAKALVKMEFPFLEEKAPKKTANKDKAES